MQLNVLCRCCIFCQQQLCADANYSQVLICNSSSGFSISHRTKIKSDRQLSNFISKAWMVKENSGWYCQKFNFLIIQSSLRCFIKQQQSFSLESLLQLTFYVLTFFQLATVNFLALCIHYANSIFLYTCREFFLLV